MVESFALAIIAMGGPPAFTGMPAVARDEARARDVSDRIDKSMAALVKAAPGAGAYVVGERLLSAGLAEPRSGARITPGSPPRNASMIRRGCSSFITAWAAKRGVLMGSLAFDREGQSLRSWWAGLAAVHRGGDVARPLAGAERAHRHSIRRLN